MYKILVVEDDRGIAEAVCSEAQKWQMDAKCAENLRDVLAEFRAYQPHLVLLDISLPFYNGYYWCTEIRKVSDVPIIFLSSASDNMNIIMAMNMGGDDFIPKPFDLNVLIAKIQAILRRNYGKIDHPGMLCHRGAVLSTDDSSLLYNGEKIALTKNEFRILLALLEARGRVVSREKLMERLWQTDSFVDENTLSVNVNRLRKKLDRAGLDDFITTKIGVGYMIE